MKPMRPFTFGLALFLVFMLGDGILHKDNFKGHFCAVPFEYGIPEIELLDIHFIEERP